MITITKTTYAISFEYSESSLLKIGKLYFLYFLEVYDFGDGLVLSNIFLKHETLLKINTLISSHIFKYIKDITDNIREENINTNPEILSDIFSKFIIDNIKKQKNIRIEFE